MVPGQAVRGGVKDLPVLFWIHGGGFGVNPPILLVKMR